MEETRKETLLRIGMGLVDKLLMSDNNYLLSDKENVVFEFGDTSFTLSVKDLTALLDSYLDDDIDISYDAARNLNALVLSSKLRLQ